MALWQSRSQWWWKNEDRKFLAELGPNSGIFPSSSTTTTTTQGQGMLVRRSKS